jgi:Disulfide bond formation protein DsbB
VYSDAGNSLTSRSFNDQQAQNFKQFAMAESLEPKRDGDDSFVPRHWQFAALLLAVAGVAGSLFLSIGMGLKACPLCFYQRTFVMAVAAVLLIGWLLRLRQEAVCILALPLAASALGVALFHVYLEFASKLECPLGILSLGTAPQQSLVLLALLFAALLGGALTLRRSSLIAAGILIGAALAAASIWSSPPMPTAPSQPYAEPLTICRPPFVAK